jgi:hypothetical protein
MAVDRQFQTAVSHSKLPQFVKMGREYGTLGSKSIPLSAELAAFGWNDCLPAAVGHTDVGKEVGYYPPPIAIDDLLCRWKFAVECPVFS